MTDLPPPPPTHTLKCILCPPLLPSNAPQPSSPGAAAPSPADVVPLSPPSLDDGHAHPLLFHGDDQLTLTATTSIAALPLREAMLSTVLSIDIVSTVFTIAPRLNQQEYWLAGKRRHLLSLWSHIKYYMCLLSTHVTTM